jgi:hypothetical protein
MAKRGVSQKYGDEVMLDFFSFKTTIHNWQVMGSTSIVGSSDSSQFAALSFLGFVQG